MNNKINYSDLFILHDKTAISLSLKDICKLLNKEIPKGTCSRQSFINQLKQFCEIEEKKSNGKATEYIIKQIYSKPLVSTIHKNNKFQEYIEQAVLTKALESPNKQLFLSNIEILYLTSLVNSNFKIICNWSLAKQLEEKAWLHGEAFTIYSILHRWVKERLVQMHSRHIIELQRGYRVYKTFINEKGQEITIKQNVDKGSDLEKKCQEIFASAIKDTVGVPNNWKGEWLPYKVYVELKRQLSIYTKTMFAKEKDKWDNVRTVNVIVPVQNESLLKDSLKQVEKILNDESKRKIKETSQLNHLTGFERAIAINELIDINTHVDYKSLLGK